MRSAPLLLRVGMMMQQARVEVLAHERVLEPTGHPVEHRGGHLDVQIGAQVAAFDAELHELECPPYGPR